MGNGIGFKKWMLKNRFPHESDELFNARIPIATWVTLIYIGTMILQSWTDPTFIKMAFFTGFILLHASLNWHFVALTEKQPWIYFVVQGVIIHAGAMLMEQAFSILLLGLIPVLIGQSFGVYENRTKRIMVSAMYYLMSISTLLMMDKAKDLLVLILMLVMMTVIVVSFANLILNQIHARIRTQTFLEDLELAHRKVEELTLANERQRMARDLHDTLAQGLAGIIMQLDAVDAHLTKGNSHRAHEIVRHSMVSAKRTLSEARSAIDNLRSKTFATVDFSDAIREEIERFQNATGIPVTVSIKITGSIPKLIVEHGLYIVGECLTNVARHAEARHVGVLVHIADENMILEIKDDGKGMDSKQASTNSGHYGIIGIRERVRILGGTLLIENNVPSGTRIKIETSADEGVIS